MKLIYICAALINLLSFSLFGIDKHYAAVGHFRIPERVLLLVTAIGGALGSFAAMHLFRHKTRTRKFRWFVPVALIVELAVLFCIITHH